MAQNVRDFLNVPELAEWVSEARRRSMDLVGDLTDEQLMGPRLSIVNPLLWEIGHVAWFQEKWVLRYVSKETPGRADADALYDSIAIPHDSRWDLPLPSRQETLRYMADVRDRVLERLQSGEPSEELIYFTLYCVFHEDMHCEAFTYTRQTLGYPLPCFCLQGKPRNSRRDTAYHNVDSSLKQDVQVAGGEFWLGASPEEPFVFDNEKWAHPVGLKPFAISRTAVTQEEFAAFVEDGGYMRQEFWSPEGWNWRQQVQAEHPVYWRLDPGGNWFRRHFDQWLPLEPRMPVIHVNWYEADAYCRWAGRRLPSEVEWEAAAAGEPAQESLRLSHEKRRLPWGMRNPDSEHANLDWRAGGCVGVDELRQGDSVWGCRQFLGNVWEWTSSPLVPYPGFVADPYKEYSEPWFRTHNVLRGGCWATRSRLLRNTYRNFYTPERRDVFAGFRTCRIDD